MCGCVDVCTVAVLYKVDLLVYFFQQELNLVLNSYTKCHLQSMISLIIIYPLEKLALFLVNSIFELNLSVKH